MKRAEAITVRRFGVRKAEEPPDARGAREGKKTGATSECLGVDVRCKFVCKKFHASPLSLEMLLSKFTTSTAFE